MAKVDVFILGSGNGASYLHELFSGELFNVEDVCMDDLSDREAIQTRLQLKRPDRGVLFVRDTSVTNMSKQKLEDLITYIDGRQSYYDVFYLCRWEDECQKIIDTRHIPYLNVTVGRTYSPKGLQAIFVSTDGCQTILESIGQKSNETLDDIFLHPIQSGKLVAFCTLNNVFEYDISQATSNLDFNKSSVCKKMANGQTPDDDLTPDNNNLGFIWFVLVVIIAILITFAIVRIGR